MQLDNKALLQWVVDGAIIMNGSQLLISNLTINDSGMYYCIGSSVVGSANNTIDILSANDSINITVIPGTTL